MGPRNHILDRGADPQGDGAIFVVVCFIEYHCNNSCATEAEHLHSNCTLIFFHFCVVEVDRNDGIK